MKFIQPNLKTAREYRQDSIKMFESEKAEELSKVAEKIEDAISEGKFTVMLDSDFINENFDEDFNLFCKYLQTFGFEYLVSGGRATLIDWGLDIDTE